MAGLLPKVLSDFARSPAKEIGDLVGEARRVRGDVRERVQKAVKQSQERIEERMAGVVKPVAQYFDVASRAEVDALQGRVGTLEKQISSLTKSAKAA